MNEYLSRSEIFKRFDAEWVLLENPKTTKTLRILGGTLLYHSKNRDDDGRLAGCVPGRVLVQQLEGGE